MSAVSYLASYLARAKFLSASYVTIVLERLASMSHKLHMYNNPINIRTSTFLQTVGLH